MTENQECTSRCKEVYDESDIHKWCEICIDDYVSIADGMRKEAKERAM